MIDPEKQYIVNSISNTPKGMLTCNYEEFVESSDNFFHIMEGHQVQKMFTDPEKYYIQIVSSTLNTPQGMHTHNCNGFVESLDNLVHFTDGKAILISSKIKLKNVNRSREALYCK